MSDPWPPSGASSTPWGQARTVAAPPAPRRRHPLRTLLIVLLVLLGLVVVADRVGAAVAERIAADQIPFWLGNGVYPIFFVWESGLFDALGQLLGRHEDVRALSRDFWDLTIDPLVEATARALGGPKIWSAMKTSAAAEKMPGAASGSTTRRRV